MKKKRQNNKEKSVSKTGCFFSHKYLCMLLGALMAHGVFMGTAGEMAKVFKLERLSELSVKKYITLGEKDRHMKTIFLVADENIPRCHT